MSIYHRVDTTVRPKSTYYNNNVYCSQSWYVSNPKVRITTTMSIYHIVNTTCQTQKYVLQQQCLFIHVVDTTCQTQSTYYNTNVYLSQSGYHVSDTKVRITTTMSIYQSWYHVSDTKVRITTTMSIYHRVNTMCQTQKYVLQQLCLFITELIPRVRHKSTHYNNNVYLSQSWYHLSDTKVCITTTMSIYHRVNTTCQTQKYVLQQQCLFITELIPRVRHKSTYYNNNVYLSQSWYHVSDPKVRIPTTMSIYHRVDTTYQTPNDVLQQQCQFITELIPRVRPKSTYYNNNVYLSQSWYHVSDPKVRITTTNKSTYYNNNVYLSQSWYHVSDPKVRITTTMSIYHRVDTTCQTQKYVLQQQCLFINKLIPRVRHKSTYYNNNVYLSQSWYHVSDPKVRITTTMSIYHRVDTTCQTQKYVLQQQCLFITELIPRVRHKSTYYNNNVYLSQSWYHVSDTKVRITTTMSIYHRVDTTCQTTQSTYYNNNVYLSQS